MSAAPEAFGEQQNRDDDRTGTESASVSENLRRAVEQAKERVTAFGTDPCTGRILAALANQNVQDHVVMHLLNGEAFSRAYCLGNFIPEEDRIIFEFICLPPKICLFPMKFLVRMNVITEKVIEVIDPAPTWAPASEQLPGAMFRL